MYGVQDGEGTVRSWWCGKGDGNPRMMENMAGEICFWNANDAGEAKVDEAFGRSARAQARRSRRVPRLEFRWKCHLGRGPSPNMEFPFTRRDLGLQKCHCIRVLVLVPNFFHFFPFLGMPISFLFDWLPRGQQQPRNLDLVTNLTGGAAL